MAPASAGTTVVEHHVHNTVQSYHPSDPATLKKIGQVSTEALGSQGYIRNSQLEAG
jgi:hypothetical protein